jgi:3D (Asp-Asp-Asp) domain-containing protein/methionine-rich copper-binding protein CopC
LEKRGYKKAKNKYGKVMATLTGAMLVSSAMLSHAPVAAANPSADSIAESIPDEVTDALLTSKQKVSEKLKDSINEKIEDSINAAIKDGVNSNLKDGVDKKIKEHINEKIKDSVNDKLQDNVNDKVKARINKKLNEALLEREDELQQVITDRVNVKIRQNQAHKVLDIVATAYASGYEDNGPWNDKTHIGTKVRPGVIAVDPRVIPLGSKVYIEFEDGRGMYAVAEDTGGAIKGNRIDIVMSDREIAKDFGIQDVKVYVLDKVIDV